LNELILAVSEAKPKRRGRRSMRRSQQGAPASTSFVNFKAYEQLLK
jgi:hypothetical protein